MQIKERKSNTTTWTHFYLFISSNNFCRFLPLVTTKTKFQWKTPTPPPPICQYTTTKFLKTTQQHQSIKKHQLPTITKLIWPNLIWNIKKKRPTPGLRERKPSEQNPRTRSSLQLLQNSCHPNGNSTNYGSNKEDENYKIKYEACVEFTGEGEKKDEIITNDQKFF